MGRETAILFAREGARVIASARRANRLEDMKTQLATEGREIEIYPADASDPAFTTHDFGPIDILVYAAGTNTPDRALSRLTPAVWNELINVNLNGAYYATQAVLPGMRAQKSGLIFYISSRSAVEADVSGAAYQASKRGLAGLAGAISVEERPNGIRTCVVCPGLADTEIMEKRLVKPSPETLAKALRPEDVAQVILAIAKLPARTWVPEVHLFPAQL
jgi:NADP-dependent 3-hydroxy acid dehydrogenase YdfG